jgi:hypothetical protein
MHHHPIQGLDKGPALELFREFSTAPAPTHLEQLEGEIVASCNGVPLALRLAGAGVNPDRCEPTDANWKVCSTCVLPSFLENMCVTVFSVMQGVRAALAGDEEVECLLRYFWKVLTAESKNMFLDVATVLRGKPCSDAQVAWRAWHGERAPALFIDLQARCLVEVRGGRLEMHDLLVELGRDKVLRRGPTDDDHYGSRLWVEGGEVKGCEAVGVLYRIYEWHACHGHAMTPLRCRPRARRQRCCAPSLTWITSWVGVIHTRSPPSRGRTPHWTSPRLASSSWGAVQHLWAP